MRANFPSNKTTAFARRSSAKESVILFLAIDEARTFVNSISRKASLRQSGSRARQFLRGCGVIAGNQKINDDVGVNEEHLLVAAPGNRSFDLLCRDRATAQLDRLGCFRRALSAHRNPLADKLSDRIL